MLNLTSIVKLSSCASGRSFTDSKVGPEEKKEAIEAEEQIQRRQDVADVRPPVRSEIIGHQWLADDTHSKGLYDPSRQVAKCKEDDDCSEENRLQTTIAAVHDSQSSSVQTE